MLIMVLMRVVSRFSDFFTKNNAGSRKRNVFLTKIHLKRNIENYKHDNNNKNRNMLI